MITASEMAQLEEHSGVDSVELMTRAIDQVVTILKNDLGVKGKRVLVVCYHSNNGGDGLGVAHKLSGETEVDVLFLGDEAKLSKASKIFFDQVNNNHAIQFVSEQDDFDHDIIVDGLLGIRMTGALRPEMVNTVKKINKTQSVKVSIDIPTGVHADTGEILNDAVNADLIITFHDIKPGIEQFKDKVKIADIGL